MSLEEPTPNLPNPNPLAKNEEEPEKKEIVEDDEEEEEDEVKKGEKTKPGTGKRTSITMYGIISGDYKCPYCTTSHKFFNAPPQWKVYTYKHVDVTSDKGMKVAKQKGFDKIPFFRVRKPGERDEWVEGLNALNDLIGTNLK